jgi:hypothetical protein
MTCANAVCGTQLLSLRSGRIDVVDFTSGWSDTGECQIHQRRVIWLCDACAGKFAVEAWRPPGEPVRPFGSAHAALPGNLAESWS